MVVMQKKKKIPGLRKRGKRCERRKRGKRWRGSGKAEAVMKKGKFSFYYYNQDEERENEGRTIRKKNFMFCQINIYHVYVIKRIRRHFI